MVVNSAPESAGYYHGDVCLVGIRPVVPQNLRDPCFGKSGRPSRPCIYGRMSAVGLPQSGSVAEKPSLTADGHDRVSRERQVAAEVALAHMHAERVLGRLSLAVE